MRATKKDGAKLGLVAAAAAATLLTGGETWANGRTGGPVAAAPAAEATLAPAPAPSPTPAIRIDAARELMIVDLSVVEDPIRTRWPRPAPSPNPLLATAARPAPGGGVVVANPSQAKWTFGRLMADMAGANDPADFVLRWLRQWEVDQTINGFVAPARPQIGAQIIDPWLAASGGARLDLSKAPFRLLAIVNRLDLRRNPSYSAGNAGEGRFVFGATDPAGNALPFTVIFEYELPARTLGDVKAWAQAWHELGSIPFGPAYNAKLEANTDRYAGRGVAPLRPNGSSINQVRTNEIALASPWELREFRLESRGGQLVQVTAKQEVDASLFGTTALADFVNANEVTILAGRHTVPPAMLAAAAPARFVLQAPGIRNPEARHKVAVATCSGCHFRETGTGFTHVGPRSPGQTAPLSGFLTGIAAPDPLTGAPHAFNDLAARAADLRHVLTTSTVALMVEPAPERRTH